MPNAHACTDPHHHVHDAKAFVAAVEHACQERGLRLTPIRARVLQLIAEAGKPVKAYELLEWVRATKGVGADAPPTVYRALDFLLEQGLIHRINVLNAFIGCPSPNIQHQSHFLICRHCGIAVELDQPALSEQILSVAREAGFTVETQALEVSGLCANCASHAPERALA